MSTCTYCPCAANLGWHRVVRVNRVSVSVATGYSWTDTVRLDRIIETRTVTA